MRDSYFNHFGYKIISDKNKSTEKQTCINIPLEYVINFSKVGLGYLQFIYLVDVCIENILSFNKLNNHNLKTRI